jgi:hypothetical protein
MSGRLDQHGSEKFNKLFNEDTAEPGTLAEIVDKHAGDALFLSAEDDGSVKGADGGIADFVGEMGEADPDDAYEDYNDLTLTGERVGSVDITGTAEGLARGFGSHRALDLGADGFQIEEIPDRALPYTNRTGTDEELDDYDDDDPTNGKYDPKDLEGLSVPGSNTPGDEM